MASGFREFYEKECHICSITMKVIAALEEKQASLSDILGQLNISKKAYQELKEGENCDPETVMQLSGHLGLNTPGLFKKCKRLK